MDFVRVVKMGESEVVFLSTRYVKLIRRHDREERADIVEDELGNMYECWHWTNCCPSFERSIVSLTKMGDY